MKRLGIYLIYDKQNIIDRYIGYMMNELQTCTDYLVAVCNMTEIRCGAGILEHYADEIFYRKNVGFDAGGFKETLCNFIGWDRVLEYDELILVNDSMFGPFKPMKSIFSEMDERPVDFWGLAKQGRRNKESVLNYKEYIQSYFLVIRYAMLHDIRFRDYWENMPYYEEFWDVVFQYEEKFTAHFFEMGYTYDVLADMRPNDSKFNLTNNYSQYAFISYELIKKRNFPFLKKQQIAYNTLSQQTQENLAQAIRYIDKETDYDVNFIWDNVIRTLNMNDLQRSLHLQYIISSEKREWLERRKIAIIIYVSYMEAAEYIIEYLEKISPAFRNVVKVLSKKNNVLELYQKKGINIRKLSKEKGAELTALCDYDDCDYVCVLYDTDVTSDINESSIGKSYLYCIWENLFRDENHICGILEKFENENRLGFLAPPQPNFASYFGNFGRGWNGQYEAVKEIAEKLKLHSPISEEKPPFRVTDNFWIRGNVLKQLKKLDIQDGFYLRYIWSYLAQDMGYYSGIAESMEYASINEVNMRYYLDRIVSGIRDEFGDFNSFQNMEEKMLIKAFRSFCEKHSHILLYGTGYYAKKYKAFLSNVVACVVSDGQRREDFFEGLPVKYLSEIQDINKYGIVLCLNKKNQEQVLPVLKEYGARDWFCIPCLNF